MTELVAPFSTTTRTRGRSWQKDVAARRRYPARVARQLALAHALQRRVDRGEFADYADLARGLGFTRARVTQLMNLLLIATDIQEEILFLEVPPGRQPITEHALRDALLTTLDWREQRRWWDALRAGFDGRLRSPRADLGPVFRSRPLNAR